MDSAVKEQYSVPKATVDCSNCGDSMYMNYTISKMVHLHGGNEKCGKKQYKKIKVVTAEPIVDTTPAVEVPS